ncbi:2-hydroxyacyl-CoA dehydratase [uncultured Sphaerochaeta sp.]|uniref:2-hydroxyacyl-CoA dehydratase n=1 Tax=uncultured Sphaerochaeta sp. TaxID=886478 RepID=UPI002A0A432B|nr:2-hydroxyacyl-CoA dehydratase [uncultured Sphaerochaeta sp.]
MAIPFTKEMKKDYTILIPNMSPVHFELVKEVFVNHGYKVVLLENQGPNVIREGLRYVHNDICYPAQLVIGQMIDALKNGTYDLDKTALVISQTGGGLQGQQLSFFASQGLGKM